jgi:hypothetical protein
MLGDGQSSVLVNKLEGDHQEITVIHAYVQSKYHGERVSPSVLLRFMTKEDQKRGVTGPFFPGSRRPSTHSTVAFQ